MATTSATLLPPNATATMQAIAQACDFFTDLPLPIRTTWNPQTCPAALLPWLAWSFGVEDWDATWTEAQQRAAIAASLPIKRIKGTAGAVSAAVAALGLHASVQEWFNQDPPGEPGTFSLTLTVDQVGFDTEQLNRLLAVINNAKNARSHLTEIQIVINSTAQLYCAGVGMVGVEITVSNYEIDSINALTLNGAWALDGTQQLNGIAAV
jgi:phage tail P2-like protein